MANAIDSIKSALNSILGVRDSLGATLTTVSLVTRTWSGTAPGDGEYTEARQVIRPSPRIVDYSQSIMISEGGAVRSGDLILKMISKVTFPKRDQIDGSSTRKNVERFYSIGGWDYTVISVTEKFLWWNVQVRRTSGGRPERARR